MGLSGATIAFDLDGTLVDTAPDLIGSLNLVLGENGRAGLPVAAARALVGQGVRHLVVEGFASAGAPLPATTVGGVVSRFVEVYRGRIAVESRPFPGVVECLDALAAAGARLVVCTNKRTDLSLALLDALALTGCFAAVVGGDKAPAQKPDGRHFLAAVEAAGGNPAHALMVGDSINDVAAAKGAGAPCIVVSFGYTPIPAAELGADRLINHFSELEGAARALLATLPRRTASAMGLRP
jgi:phosphoglycolate phosphatase